MNPPINNYEPTLEQMQAVNNGRVVPTPVTEMARKLKMDPWVHAEGLERDIVALKITGDGWVEPYGKLKSSFKAILLERDHLESCCEAYRQEIVELSEKLKHPTASRSTEEIVLNIKTRREELPTTFEPCGCISYVADGKKLMAVICKTHALTAATPSSPETPPPARSGTEL